MILGLDPEQFWLAVGVTVFAGFVKGAIGFAMPMIMMSAFGSFLSATTALALLIIPTLLTNAVQAFRQGIGPALASARLVWRHILAVVLCIPVTAMAVQLIPQSLMLLTLGVPITLYALWQLSGRPLRLHLHHRRRAEVATGVIGGLYGGLSGLWGPPLLVYLLSIDASKRDSIRIQGVVYMIGALALLLSHLASGVLNANTAPASAAMMVPAALGMALGLAVQDRLDQTGFRRATQVLLVVSGLNLIRRALQIGL